MFFKIGDNIILTVIMMSSNRQVNPCMFKDNDKDFIIFKYYECSSYSVNTSPDNLK